MFTPSRIIAAFAIVLLAAGSTLAADRTAFQGTLIGEDGKPFGGAEIHAQRLDAKAKEVVARTKPDGHYYFIGLPPGSYAITAYVDGEPVSRANARTRSDGWVRVNFDLRLNAKGADGTDRMQRDVVFGNGSIFPRDNAGKAGLGGR